MNAENSKLSTPEVRQSVPFSAPNAIVISWGGSDWVKVGIAGPSRDRIAKSILNMDKAVEALRRIANCELVPGSISSVIDMKEIARVTLKSIEA